MSIFDGKRLDNNTFKLDVERMRKGWYTDKYFSNIAEMLTTMTKSGYCYQGNSPRLNSLNIHEGISSGDLEVEMQVFTRRRGPTITVGLDKSLAMLKLCTGYWENEKFFDTSKNLEVWAVHDGEVVHGNGDPSNVEPVMRIRGRYRDFAILETPILGVLTRSSRVATNVYQTLISARGKPVMFFPARFDVHEVQAADGYSYNIAIQRFNKDFAGKLPTFISTDAQGDWWGGQGGGTVAHAAIACFFGDTAEAMLAFSTVLPMSIPRIALVDFNNDSVSDSTAVAKVLFAKYRELVDSGDSTEAERYRLFGVRLDTSATLRDASLPPLGDPTLDLGVNPRLVFNVRQALDHAWEAWNLPLKWHKEAAEYCEKIKIVVSGGFNPEKIERFEKLNVPVDTYAVGSSLFDNHGLTVTDYTADVVRVKVQGEWVDLAKVGRRSCENPSLERVW
jgi:nicotinate phosphoribosyltransferase